MPKLKIPEYAKREAQQGLELRKKLSKTNKFGLSPKKAQELGIFSGVIRAKQIINNNSIEYRDAYQIYRFYQRFKNCTSPKCEGTIKLWGGRKFGIYVSKWIRKQRRL